MKKSIAILSAVAAVSAVAFAASPAHAEDVSLSVQGGAAANLNVPWSTPGRVVDRPSPYGVGLDAGGKLLFKLVPNLAVGPAVSVAYLPVEGSPDRAAVLWNFGGVARLQGSRDAAWSPYVEVGASAAKQAAIWNPGVTATVGADVALESTHTFWAGPFVSASRTFQLHDDAASQTPFINHDDGNMLVAGLSLSFDAPVKQKVLVETTVVEHQNTVQVTEHTVCAPAAAPVVSTPAPQAFRLTERVAFEKDSAELSTSAAMTLDEVVQEINAHPGVEVRVEGVASAEGTAAHNLTLSHLRAGTVAAYLAAHGVDPSRLVPVSVGATGAPNDASNRVVDFIVINLVTSSR